MLRLPPLLLLLTAAACQGDETVADPDATWRLTALDGQPFDASATLRFGDGTISGSGPCNAFGGTLTTPLPGFGAGPLRATRAVCPEIDAERAFLDALAAMTRAEVAGDVLTLSDGDGREMAFRAD